MRPNLNLIVRSLQLAVGFLTIFPVRHGGNPPTERELAASRFAFPFVGLLVGLALAGLSEGLRLSHAGPAISAALLLAAGVMLTGGLHMDGVADACDGLFMPRGDAQRRLEVMRDPHVGSFGTTAIALLLIAKFAALVTLAGHGRSASILGAAFVARTLVLVAAGVSRPARHDGTGRFLIVATRREDALFAIVLVCGIGGVASRQNGLNASIVAAVTTWLITRLATAKLGGITGDILGAVVELGELAFLVTLALAATP